MSAGEITVTEIKSAIELAMERTKGLQLSSEERKKIKEEEIIAKAQGLVNRFLQVDFHLRDMEKELAKFDPDQRGHLEQLIFYYLVEAIHFDKENDLVFQGIEAYRKGSLKSISPIRKLIENYQENNRKEYQKITEELLNKFKSLGISGTAVLPKVDGSREWKDALSQLKPGYEDQLRTLKRELHEG